MNQILGQLGELLLNAVPTAVLLLILYASYHFIVHKPLEKMLAERHERTEGAVQKARADIAAAEAKTAEYEQRLREAKVALFKSQESRRAQAQHLRNNMIAGARTTAQAKVASARTAIQQDADAAKKTLQAESERLATEIIGVLMRPVAAASKSTSEGSR